MPAAIDRSVASPNSHDIRRTGNDAALRGALKAFATPPSTSQQPSPKPATPRAAVTQGARGKRPPPRPTTSSTSVKIPMRTTGDTVNSPVTPQTAPARQTSNFEWAQSLNAALTQSSAPAGNVDVPPKPNKPPDLVNRTVRPKLVIPATVQAEDGIVKAQGPAPEIHSPKPVRRVTAAASFEAASIDLKTQPITSQVSSDDARDDSLGASVDTPLSSGQSPAPAPVRRNAPQVQPNTASLPLIRSRSKSLTNVRQASSSYSDRTNKRKITPSAVQGPHEDDAQRIESLANAIVASHLASSRAPSRATSPAKSPNPMMPPLHRRQTDKPHHNFPMFKSSKGDSRTPSPAKRMRHTLRKQPSDEDEDDMNPRRPRGHFHIRQHPNKHHEGDRKRWRDEITQRERKRYEGVWAANKDVYMRYTAEELESPAAMEKAKGSVSALVVRDVWLRSRLPPSALEEIWDLVDRKQLGRLDREEFVVGLWLVDQRLRGRKLPVKVGSSVWQSVRGIYGLKVPKKKA